MNLTQALALPRIRAAWRAAAIDALAHGARFYLLSEGGL